MATVRYYPIDDTIKDHSCNPSSDEGCAPCIKEHTADDDTSYIYHSVTGTSNNSHTSVVYSGRVYPPDISAITNGKDYIWISSARVYVRAKVTATSGTASVSCVLRDGQGSSSPALASASSSSLTTSYQTFNGSSSSLAGVYYTDYDHEDATPWIYLFITTQGRKSSSKSSNFNIRVTQAYAEFVVYNCWDATAIATAHTTASVDRPRFYEGGTVTFTATVDSGYDFIGWLDATNYQKYQQGQTYSVQSTSLTYSFAIQSDCTYYAVAKRPITVNAVATTGVSSATVAWSASDNAYKWQATVSSGYTFVGWLDATNYQAYQNGGSYSVLSSSTTYLYTPTSDTTLYAVALIPQRNIVIHNSANGTAMYRESASDPWTSIAGGQTGTATVSEDDSITLKVVPQASYDLCRLVEEQEVSSGERSRVSIDFPTYKYTLEALDAQGNTAEKIVYDAIAEKQYKYDGNGNLIGEEDLDDDMTVQIEALLNEIYTNGLPLGESGDWNVYLYYSQGLSRLFTNANGVWKKIVSVYHKESGAWVQSATGIQVNKLGRNLQENEGLEDGDYIIISKEE